MSVSTSVIRSVICRPTLETFVFHLRVIEQHLTRFKLGVISIESSRGL